MLIVEGEAQVFIDEKENVNFGIGNIVYILKINKYDDQSKWSYIKWRCESTISNLNLNDWASMRFTNGIFTFNFYKYINTVYNKQCVTTNHM